MDLNNDNDPHSRFTHFQFFSKGRKYFKIHEIVEDGVFGLAD